MCIKLSLRRRSSMLNLQWVRIRFKQGHLSCWPEKCPGYKKGYKAFFQGMPFQYQLKALYFFHRQMKKVIAKLDFAESISNM